MNLFSTQDLRLLPLVAEHEAFYIELANHPDIRDRVNNSIPYDHVHFHELVAFTTTHPKAKVWVIEFEGELCGAITFAPLKIHAGIYQGGYWLQPSHWGRGLASAALQQVTDYLFKHGAERVQAVVEPDNPASMRVLEKSGFLNEGLLRRYYPSRYRGLLDVHMFARIAAD